MLHWHCALVSCPKAFSPAPSLFPPFHYKVPFSEQYPFWTCPFLNKPLSEHAPFWTHPFLNKPPFQHAPFWTCPHFNMPYSEHTPFSICLFLNAPPFQHAPCWHPPPLFLTSPFLKTSLFYFLITPLCQNIKKNNTFSSHPFSTFSTHPLSWTINSSPR